MKIYFGHAKNFDYENEYYKPIEESSILKEENIIFPHKNDANHKFEREFYTNLDLFIAEVSYRATGLGIELGFASDDNIPIFCFYKKGSIPAGSLKKITDHIIEYETLEDLKMKIEQVVINFKKNR